MSRALRRSLRSLQVPNYRRYFAGQVVSLSGNWVQMVAETWLVLELTGSGFAIGVAAALQFLPMMLVGAWGGLIADRFAKRRLLMVTQMAMALPALALFAVTVGGVVQLWMIYLLILVRGTVNAVDNPTRQAFIVELVGRDGVFNAVSLNSALINSARIIGPGIAGVLIATVGVEPCFVVNALSFGGMLVALRLMDPAALAPAPVASRAPGQVRSGLRYVWATAELRIPLIVTALVGTLAFNFTVLLPLLADFTFHGGASTYALLLSAMGVGAVLGAVANGARASVRPQLLIGAAAIFGSLLLALAIAPTEQLAIAALVPLGAASVAFSATANSALQLAVEPQMRGRVMALYSVVFFGSTPIGGPLMGWLSGATSPRVAIAIGGTSGLAAAVGARRAYRRANVALDAPVGRTAAHHADAPIAGAPQRAGMPVATGAAATATAPAAVAAATAPVPAPVPATATATGSVSTPTPADAPSAATAAAAKSECRRPVRSSPGARAADGAARGRGARGHRPRRRPSRPRPTAS